MRPKAPNPLTDNGLRANCGCRVLIRDRTGWDFLVEFGLSQTEVGTEVVLLVKVNGDHVQRPIGRGHSSVVHGHSSVVHGHSSVVDGHLSVVHGHLSVVDGQMADVHGPEPRVGGRKPVVGGPRGGFHAITLRSAAASEVTGVVSQAFRV